MANRSFRNRFLHPSPPVCLPLRSGVCFPVLLPEVLHAGIGIFLRRSEAGMTQKFLDATQIGSVFKQMRGEAVPEGVGRDPAAGGEVSPVSGQKSFNGPRCQPRPP